MTAPTPGAPRDVTFNVVGVPVGQVTDVRVTGLSMVHTWTGDLVVTLIAPNGASHLLFGRTGATSAGAAGDDANVNGTYAFADDAAGNWWSTVVPLTTNQIVPNGTYRTSAIGGPGSTGAVTAMSAAFAGVSNPNGTWTLRFTDGCAQDTGSVTAATLELLSGNCAPEQAKVGTAQGKVTTTSAALTTAQANAATADQAVVDADKAVGKAKKKLKKAKESGDEAKTKKAKKKLKKAKSKLKAAQQAAPAAHQLVTTAQAAKNAAQAELTAAQSVYDGCLASL